MNFKYLLPFIAIISPNALWAQKMIILTNTPQKVPAGKIWKLQTNKKILIEVSYSTLKSGNRCNADILSNPSFIGSIIVGEYGFPQHVYGLFIKDLEKERYTNNETYSIIPISIIDDKFNIEELSSNTVENVGRKELIFYPGEKLYTFNCLESIQLLELPMSGKENKSADSKSIFKRENLDIQSLKKIKNKERLYKVYGDNNITVREVSGLDDDFRKGTEYILYGNSNNEAAINFEMNYIVLEKKLSQWKLPYNLFVGEKIGDVVKTNGKDFLIYGFEWDYGGEVCDWKNGRISSVIVKFAPTQTVSDSLYNKVMGEKKILTSNIILKKLSLIIDQIIIPIK